MAQTFYEMLNTVAFRNLAGKVNGEKDLWALRDLLFQKMCEMQERAVFITQILNREGYIIADSVVTEDYDFMIRMIEKDIMTIERYCKQRGIMRDVI